MERVFILASRPMFGQGVKSLLDQEADFQIVGQEASIEKAILRIKDLQPDVIILDNHDIPKASLDAIAHILRMTGNARVISLSLKQNTMHIYHAAQKIVSDPADLTSAIRDRPRDG